MDNSTITIGIAEDHIFLRKALQIALDSIGFKVLIVAADGLRFLEQMSSVNQPPSLCIIDVNMPVMDGCVTVRKLKAAYPSVRVLAMTVFENDKKRNAILAAGADDFIVKSEPIEKWEQMIIDCYTKGSPKSNNIVAG
ncbi:MAG: response regulator transcription factor [Agriterribacter sp.]